MLQTFQTKTILITGASRGIGAAIAQQFAALGARLILNCGHDPNTLSKTVEELHRQFPSCEIHSMYCDISNAEDLEQEYRQAVAVFGAPDILINNAGIAHIGLLQDMSAAEISQLIATNLTGAILLGRLCIPTMLQRVQQHSDTSCAILNISSVWGQTGASCEAVYSATKGGLNTFTKALAKELAPSGIPVNGIACGLIDTEMNACLDEETKKALCEEIPFGRMATPREVAEFAVCLLSAPAYMTGQTITFDGGWC